MIRKRLGLIVSLGLLVGLGLTFLTGFVAAALDLNRFAYHKYAAYLVIALALAHVVLHWRSLMGQVRRWLLGVARDRRAQSPRLPKAVGEASAVAPRLSRRSLLWPGLALGAGAGLGHWWASRGTALALEEGRDLGQVYHRWSTPSYLGLLSKSFHVLAQPAPYKEYPDAPVVPLPDTPPAGGPPIEAVIAQRRSVREYHPRPLRLEELSRLLHYSGGITDRRDPTFAFRAAPSSGALFPTEIYPVVFNIRGAVAGVYHYDVQRHRLELLRAGDFRQEMFRAAVSQEMILHASMVLVLTGLFGRVHWKYVDRSYRYLLLEAGHLGQNLYLTATALGLGPCGIGAFFDDEVDRLLGIDGRDEVTVYLMAVGPISS